MSADYKALSEARKHKVLRKFLLKLMRGCFKDLWVMIVDNIEYGDDDSMTLFRTMAQQETVFFVLSLERKINGEHELHPDVLERARVIRRLYLDLRHFVYIRYIYKLSPV